MWLPARKQKEWIGSGGDGQGQDYWFISVKETMFKALFLANLSFYVQYCIDTDTGPNKSVKETVFSGCSLGLGRCLYQRPLLECL